LRQQRIWVERDRRDELVKLARAALASGDKVRIAQYISMMPAEENNEPLRQWRVASWKDRIAPEGYAFPGDPRKWEQTKYSAAVLDDLGKKLLGLEKW